MNQISRTQNKSASLRYIAAAFSIVLATTISSTSVASNASQSYAAARAVWLKTRSTREYQKYAAEFSQFNNHFHLDERNGCYSMPGGPVELMLVITQHEGARFAVVERVYTDVHNAKAQCFEESYRNIPTKIPPFTPFVLQMTMQ